jgi:hypothetical protein
VVLLLTYGKFAFAMVSAFLSVLSYELLSPQQPPGRAWGFAEQ